MWLSSCLLCLFWYIFPALGNVEKTMFVAPQAIQIFDQYPNLDTLRLEVLSHQNMSLRRQIPAAFPTSDSKRGIESWFLLDKLNQHQRYEVRICWVATVRNYWSKPCSLSIRQ